MTIRKIIFSDQLQTQGSASLREALVAEVCQFNTRETDSKLPDVCLEIDAAPASSTSHQVEIWEDLREAIEKPLGNPGLFSMAATLEFFAKHLSPGYFSIIAHVASYCAPGLSWDIEKGYVEGKAPQQAAPRREMDGRDKVWLPEDPKYSRKQWIVSSHVNEEFDELLCMVKNQDLIYSRWHFSDVDPRPKCIVCFHGPAGTGKTMAAHILAHELGKKIICAKYSDIESRWMGETTKHLSSIFESAQKQGAVLFFDECDNFLSKRIESVSSSADQAVNSSRGEMLMLMEDFQGIVVLATNLITNVDHAFESRILKFLNIELPNAEARLAMIRSKLPPEAPVEDSSDAALAELVEISDGFSGREIRNAILQGFVKAAKDHTEGAPEVITRQHLKSAFESVRKSLPGNTPPDDGDLGEIDEAAQGPLRELAQKKLDASSQL